ncbi:MAG: hypothetical protein KAT48_09855 [Bacteroidales bacterium]|nr:hypothetical protein [Bacteroidales bacterium]
MKKILYSFIILLAVSSVTETYGQGKKIQLGALAGYQLGGRMKFYEGQIKFVDSGNWGLFLDVEAQPAMFIELSYSNMKTIGRFTPYKFTYQPRDINMTIDYFQVGARRILGGNEKIDGYGLFTMGVAWFNSLESDINDYVSFSIALGGGADIYLTEKFGIRLQGRLLMPMNFAGVGFYGGIGTGGAGGGLSLNAWSPVVQGDFSGGVFIVLGN